MLGEYALINLASYSDGFLGPVLVVLSHTNFGGGITGHFRYTLTFTINQVTVNTISFNTAANCNIDLPPSGSFSYKNAQRFTTTTNSTFNFDNFTVDAPTNLFTRLSPCFCPSVLSATVGLGENQSITFTKLGHTFRQIA